MAHFFVEKMTLAPFAHQPRTFLTIRKLSHSTVLRGPGNRTACSGIADALNEERHEAAFYLLLVSLLANSPPVDFFPSDSGCIMAGADSSRFPKLCSKPDHNLEVTQERVAKRVTSFPFADSLVWAFCDSSGSHQ